MKFFSYNSRRAFTLMEILITVIIVGVIATLGLVQYIITVEKMRAKTAEHLVATQLANFRRYIVEKQVVPGVSCPTGVPTHVAGDWYVTTSGGGTVTNPVCVFAAFRMGGSGNSLISFISGCPGGGGVGALGYGPSKYGIYITYEWCSPVSSTIKCVSGSSDPNICTQMGYN